MRKRASILIGTLDQPRYGAVRGVPAFVQESAAIRGPNVRIGKVRAASARMDSDLYELRH